MPSSEDPRPVEKTSEGVVVLEYADLVNDRNLSASIAEAFGAEGHCLGICVVRGVPGYEDSRKRLLPLAQRFATMPDALKAKTVHEKSLYSFGWSHGKEMFNGVPDTSKGSFYANPQYDRPCTDEKCIEAHPAECNPNIWPDEDLPDLHPAFMETGQIIVDVGKLVAKHCDRYVDSVMGEVLPEAYRMENIISASMCAKGRLLHYFPVAESAPLTGDYASWCGWHLDHGTLTGLCRAMYLDEAYREVPAPNPIMGLYIKTRGGAITKATIPEGCLAFQMGESSSIHSAGILVATPHCVQGGGSDGARGVSRNTLAVFMEPNWDVLMTVPGGVAEKVSVKHWEATMNFHEFSSAKVMSYSAPSKLTDL
jgi:isopenicillin N synthase-like dioxygenase